MKASCFATIFLLALSSCYKTIDSTKEVCTSGCTIIQGRVTTLNDRPVSGVTVTIGSVRNASSAGRVKRTIARATSGSDGYYRLKFALNEYESGQQASADVYLQYNYDTTAFTPIPVLSKDVLLSSPRTVLLFTNKEITLDRSIYLPQKTKANIRLQGFYSTGSDFNRFEVTPSFRIGVYSWYQDGAYVVVSQSAVTEKTVDVAGNDSTRFHIEKWKGGQRIMHDTSVFTPLAQTTSLIFNF